MLCRTCRKKYRYNVFVTDLIKFLSEPTLDIISPIVDKLFVKIDTTTMKPYEDQDTEYVYEEIEIQGVKQTHTEHYEDVADINGIVLPMLFYDYLQNGQQNCILQNLFVVVWHVSSYKFPTSDDTTVPWVAAWSRSFFYCCKPLRFKC